jgi:hypothetical protein
MADNAGWIVVGDWVITVACLDNGAWLLTNSGVAVASLPAIIVRVDLPITQWRDRRAGGTSHQYLPCNVLHHASTIL